MNTKDIDNAINTPTVITLVKSYLLARVFSEVTRQKVDKIHREILTETPIFSDEVRHGKYREASRQLFLGRDLYLTSNEQAVQDFYLKTDTRERKEGIKPDSMGFDYCPALVAEAELSQIGCLLIDTSGAPLGVSNSEILCGPDGLANRQKWIDLVVGAITKLHNIKNLTEIMK